MRGRGSRYFGLASAAAVILSGIGVGQGMAVAGQDPTETTIVPPAPSRGGPAVPGVEGVWQVGTRPDQPSFTITGTLLAGRTACGSFLASLLQMSGRAQILVLSMPMECPRRIMRDQTVFRMQLEATHHVSVSNGLFEARDQRGTLLFQAGRMPPAALTPAVLGTLDGAWSGAAATPRRRSAPAAPVLRIRGSQLQITGACGDYSGTLATGPVSPHPAQARVLISSTSQRQCAVPESEAADAALLRRLEAVRFVWLTQGRLEFQTVTGETTLRLTRL